MSHHGVPGLSRTDGIILGLLEANGWKELYGREMVERSDGALARGSIYVLLHRMEHDKGFVESRRAADGTFKRLYQATGYGQKSYVYWKAMHEYAEKRSGLSFPLPTPQGG